MTNPTNAPSSNEPVQAREWSTKVFLGFLGIITCFYAVILIYHSAKPPETVAEDDDSILEQCRQLFMQYGLVSNWAYSKRCAGLCERCPEAETDRRSVGGALDSTFQTVASEEVKVLNQPACRL